MYNIEISLRSVQEVSKEVSVPDMGASVSDTGVGMS